MSYFILDIEVDATTVRRRFCDPLEREHKIVMLQGKRAGQPARYVYNAEGINRHRKFDLTNAKVLVGHNIKFDLLYLWDNPDIRAFIERGGFVWDTALAEFLLEGQDKQQRYSLKEIGRRHNLNIQKLDTVQAYLDEGKKFSEVPKEEAIYYGVQDVLTTEELYLLQIKRTKEANMLDLMKTYMRHYVALIEMEYNGLRIDPEALKEGTEKQQQLVDGLEKQLRTIVKEQKLFGSDYIEFNINSLQHVSCVLFGGELTETQKLPVMENGQVKRYKTGKRIGEPVLKNTEVTLKIKGLHLDTKYTEKSKNGFYQTGDAVLERYKQVPFVQLLLTYRKEFKLLSTYYLAFNELVNPYDGCVHGEYNALGTVTGRLSCKNPNMQNLAPSMLNIFVSRFKGGHIATFDFSQLEVRLAAMLSQDGLMIEEINRGKDMHLNNASLLYNKRESEVTDQERKTTKALTFGLFYGQQAKMMAYVHNIPVETAERFIEVFYNKYVDVKIWHKITYDKIKLSKQNTQSGVCSYLQGRNNKHYKLYQYLVPEWKDPSGTKKEFSPTECKNYPVQGLAADVMAYTAGQFCLSLKQKHQDALIKIINEVHDELVLDIDDPTLEYGTQYDIRGIAGDIKNELESYANDYILKKCKFYLTTRLEIEYNIGNNLKECK